MTSSTDLREQRNSSSRRRHRRRAGRGDGGLVLLETAIGLPVLFLLIFGVLEVGMAIKSYSGASNAVSAGGRAGSVAGNYSLADADILARVATESAGIGSGEIEYVIVWHASGPGTSVPAGCIPGTPPSAVNGTSVGVSDGGTDAVGACNVYNRPNDPGGAFDMATDALANPPEYYFGCSGSGDPMATHKVDCNWPGQNRKTTTTPREGFTGTPRTPDYVGVYIKAEHNYVTGILGNSLSITDSSINLIEPQGYSLS